MTVRLRFLTSRAQHQTRARIANPMKSRPNLPTRAFLWGIVLAAVCFSSCGGAQSALEPAGPQAVKIAGLWWIMLAVGTLVLLGVMVLLAIAMEGFPRRWQELTARGATKLVLAGGVAIPSVVLFGLLVYSVLVDRAISQTPPEDSVTVEVIGHRWWWEVHYINPEGRRLATTANEIHIPIGEPIRLELRSSDVVHSFWVPNLNGKTDLIPGRTNTSWIQSDRAGVYRGQCAEFCGLQHAKMAFLVVVEPPDQFDAWLELQAAPSAEPNTAALQRGQEVFTSNACARCHTIRGTTASGKRAPDLTHIGGRRTIAAATLGQSRGNLGGWITDPHSIKPGTLMPPTVLPPQELRSLLGYLDSLK